MAASTIMKCRKGVCEGSHIVQPSFSLAVKYLSLCQSGTNTSGLCWKMFFIGKNELNLKSVMASYFIFTTHKISFNECPMYVYSPCQHGPEDMDAIMAFMSY